VGSLTLWNNPDKVSGRLRLFMLEGEELYVFEAKERGAQSEAPPAEQNTDVAKGDIPF
jgi:hypothetical protein